MENDTTKAKGKRSCIDGVLWGSRGYIAILDVTRFYACFTPETPREHDRIENYLDPRSFGTAAGGSWPPIIQEATLFARDMEIEQARDVIHRFMTAFDRSKPPVYETH